MSREHVFPTWMVGLFPELGELDYVRRLVLHTDDVDHQRPGPPFDVVVRDVCVSCNTGWMEKLETEARPVLTPMFTGSSRVLTASEQFVVATWATKTMLTVQGSNLGGERVASTEQYGLSSAAAAAAELARMALPVRGQDALAGQCPPVRVLGAICGQPPPQVGAPLNGFGVVFAVGHLAIWLFGAEVPDAPRPQSGSDDAHILVWPTLGPDVRWPPPKALKGEADLEALARRMPAGTDVHGPSLRVSPGYTARGVALPASVATPGPPIPASRISRRRPIRGARPTDLLAVLRMVVWPLGDPFVDLLCQAVPLFVGHLGYGLGGLDHR